MKRKKIWFTFAILVFVLSAAAVGFYHYYVPYAIARSITDTTRATTTTLIPKEIRKKIDKVKKPANEVSLKLVETAQKTDISMDAIFDAIDNVEEAELNSFLDKLRKTRMDNKDEIFDLAKTHFDLGFDIEPFREMYKETFTIKRIRKLVSYLDANRNSEAVDIGTAKMVAKNILKNKHAQVEEITRQR